MQSWSQIQSRLREKRGKINVSKHLMKNSATVDGYQEAAPSWIDTTKKVKGGVLGTNILNFLLRYKSNFGVSPKLPLVIIPLFLPFIMKLHKNSCHWEPLICCHPLPLLLDISLTIGLILIPYLPKAVGPVLIFPGLSAALGKRGCIRSLPLSLVFLFLHRDEFLGLFQLPSLYTIVGSNIQHHSLSFLFFTVLCSFIAISHKSPVDDLKILTSWGTLVSSIG